MHKGIQDTGVIKYKVRTISQDNPTHLCQDMYQSIINDVPTQAFNHNCGRLSKWLQSNSCLFHADWNQGKVLKSVQPLSSREMVATVSPNELDPVSWGMVVFFVFWVPQNRSSLTPVGRDGFFKKNYNFVLEEKS